MSHPHVTPSSYWTVLSVWLAPSSYWTVPAPSRTVQGLDAWLKPSKFWTLFFQHGSTQSALPSVCHRPVIGRFPLHRASARHRPVIGRLAGTVRLGRFIGQSPQCVAHTVQSWTLGQTVQILDAFFSVACTVPSALSATVQLLDGSLHAATSRDTVQLLDGSFSAWLAQPKSCLAQTVQILDTFFSVACTVPSALSVPPSSYWTVPSVPQLSVARTVQNLDAWLVLHGLVSRLHHPRLAKVLDMFAIVK